MIPESIFFPTWNGEQDIPITIDQTNNIVHEFRNNKNLDFLLKEVIRMSSGQQQMFNVLKSDANELMQKLNNFL